MHVVRALKRSYVYCTVCEESLLQLSGAGGLVWETVHVDDAVRDRVARCVQLRTARAAMCQRDLVEWCFGAGGSRKNEPHY